MPRRHGVQAGRARAWQPGLLDPGAPGYRMPSGQRSTGCPRRMVDAAGLRTASRGERRAGYTDRLRELPYAEQYAAWQRARWHLGLGEGPIDVLGARGDTLLAAWFAGAGHVCYESLLQRAAGDDLVALRACDAHAPCRRQAQSSGPRQQTAALVAPPCAG